MIPPLSILVVLSLSLIHIYLQHIDPKWIVKRRVGPFGCEALVNNKAMIRRLYPELLIDNATLEEIMLFYVKGEEK